MTGGGASRLGRPVLIAAVLLALLAAGGAVAFGPDRSEGTVVPAEDARAEGEWLSGAVGEGVLSGEFGRWRGRPVEIVGQFSSSNADMVHLWGLKEENWPGPMDIALGGIGPGETWAQAAAGAYDERWRESLRNVREVRVGAGTSYLRLAHEMNGNWFPWSVRAEDVPVFREAWKRFRSLQEELYPEALLVFCASRESVGLGADWRTLFPGAEYVDVLAVDIYNHFPFLATAQEWQDSLDDVDRWGAPKGLGAHLEFARDVGLPFAIPEWSGNADHGDSPAFMEGMHGFLEEHGGSGPGQVLYEIVFNSGGGNRGWLLFGDGVRLVESAEAYRRLW